MDNSNEEWLTLEDAVKFLNSKSNTENSWSINSLLTKCKHGKIRIVTKIPRHIEELSWFSADGRQVDFASDRLIPLNETMCDELIMCEEVSLRYATLPIVSNGDVEYLEAGFPPGTTERIITLKNVIVHRAELSRLQEPLIQVTPHTDRTWIQTARELGENYIKEWQAAGYTPTGDDAAAYCEAEFLRIGVFGRGEEFLRAENIKREALAGITNRKPGERAKGAKVPREKRENLPSCIGESPIRS